MVSVYQRTQQDPKFGCNLISPLLLRSAASRQGPTCPRGSRHHHVAKLCYRATANNESLVGEFVWCWVKPPLGCPAMLFMRAVIMESGETKYCKIKRINHSNVINRAEECCHTRPANLRQRNHICHHQSMLSNAHISNRESTLVDGACNTYSSFVRIITMHNIGRRRHRFVVEGSGIACTRVAPSVGN